MSDSRLEKFIYAICSMDVSDLPVPLSRIEKLWNCLITGETPDFEPLSRNEKYLMAMLDRYDISNLPAPMSRGEKLLYKIAVGETDLSDVPGYLSRYEELLKYLIENGGISGGDFEYVLYTLNQSLSTLYLTAEKPVKSAILSGNTLKKDAFVKWATAYGSNVVCPIYHDGSINRSYKVYANRRYTVIRRGIWENVGYSFYNDTNEPIQGNIKSETFTPNVDGYIQIFVDGGEELRTEDNYKNFIVIEGEADKNIPYFEGMQSVKMPVLKVTGKNLFDGEIEIGTINNNGNLIPNSNMKRPVNFTKVKGNTTYTFSKTNDDGYVAIHQYDKNKKFISYVVIGTTRERTFTTNVNTNFLKFRYESLSECFFQIEESSVATTYEPYKSNILTVNEEVELRGIGDVQDTLDLMTGEVTERIGEIVFDGTEEWKNPVVYTNTVRYMSPKLENYKLNSKNVIMGNLQHIYNHNLDEPHCAIDVGGYLFVFIPKTELEDTTVNSVKKYFQKNNTKFQYELETPTIKTVDLTVVNQDNQPTQLGTFENVTHVSLEAENLIPEVEMEVATNLLEDTVFNLTNAFNTLNSTAEKPVKSAILKGQTLVNLLDLSSIESSSGIIVNHDNKTVEYVLNQNQIVVKLKNLKANTKYAILYDVYTDTTSTNSPIRINDTGDNYNNNVYSKLNTKTFTTNDDVSNVNIIFYNISIQNIGFKCSFPIILEYQDGMENWDLPYFEGMQSVKMPVLTTTGKNLFDGGLVKNKYYNGSVGELVAGNNNLASVNPTRVNPNTDIVLSTSAKLPNNSHYICEYASDGTFIKRTNSSKITTSETTYFIKFHFAYETKNESPNVQLEEGSTATSYEPYKSNILTTNEEVELRKVGDVQDELNLLTGELTQRIGEVVLDGSDDEQWSVDSPKDNINRYLLRVDNLKGVGSNYSDLIKCDKWRVFKPIQGQTENQEGIYINGWADKIHMGVDVSRLSENSLNGFKQWLSKNPLTVQFLLGQEVVKTVDLTVVDQDGNETNLRTFDDTTHVLLNSEGLIPAAALTVRTKIPSALSTGLLMDDISTKQEELNTMVDEQSENVDATMIATTEIFEEIL